MAGFELAIQGGGQTLQRAWTSAELEKGVGWLKRMNARGHDIAIRPAGEHGLVLVAGLTERRRGAYGRRGLDVGRDHRDESRPL